MQLKKIKIAGFKSFVDPTTVLVPSNLVAIVGPNGCGKSNIIDAVSWVMGESSAKYLRGESLTDVIFSGSSARKPVGQASVELIFDNQDGMLGGEYASYAEISIRRLINRDSESTYFLNGARCRRRDIIDIFLGTGLGPRSYSIIGQNMISRIIDAKPDDMRAYLEEAAGISKYKERRRETENRIHHTKENLARLEDVRTELDKQLVTLKRQANAAEKYKELKQEERLLRAQWLAAQWRQYDARLVQYSLQTQQQETAMEACQAEMGELNLKLDQLRNDHTLGTESLQEVQRRYYVAGNDITRIEQDIHHTQERERQWQADKAQVEHDWEEAKQNLEELTFEQSELAEEMLVLEPQLEEATLQVETMGKHYQTAEEAMQQWQAQSDAFNQRTAKTTQTAQVEQTRMTHLEQRLTTLKQRMGQMEQEHAQMNSAQLEQEIADYSLQVAQLTEVSEEHDQQLEDIRTQINQTKAAQQQLTQQLDQVRHQLQRLHGQQASLEALQQTALGQRNQSVTKWLAKHQLDQLPRLAQGIEVAAGWEQVVEKVLGSHLQAICVDDLSVMLPKLTDLTEGSISLFATQTTTQTSPSTPTLLLSKIQSKWPLDSLLAGIYVAESHADALALCATLAPHESVFTPDGMWFSPAWLRLSREENPAAGVFQREQELKQLATQIDELTAQQEQLQDQLIEMRESLMNLEQQRDDVQRTVNQAHAQLNQARTQYQVKQERLAELNARAERYQNELTQNRTQFEQTTQEFTQARQVWQVAMGELEKLAEQRDQLQQQRDQLRDQVQQYRQQWNQAKEQHHQLEIRLQTTKSQHGLLQQTLSRMQAHLSTLDERRKSLAEGYKVETSLDELETELNIALSHRLQIEDELNQVRASLEAINQQLHALEDERHQIERNMAKVRDMLETSRLEAQGLKVKIETILEQLVETQFQLEDLLKELSEDTAPEIYHQYLEQTLLRITRLGAINLVAIEEYAACAERKEYLDKQQSDLQEGLTTLENAIAKIDKETRARFKETFDKVNEHFQTLFPKIFGGGRAYLELTGENLLDAGITLMACPPGKRNSTIHLLSGGEKAMTAIALVFSIFHLNPAPFCLLDEVDAPLDDANIGRFCELVKSMSEKTQFIFISHNKLAIEMGHHLMGVTMHEPGVSRLVSVNIEEAVNLAAT